MMLPSNSERGEDDDDCIEVKIIGAQMVHAAQRSIAIRITIQFRFLAEVWLTRRRSCEDSEMRFK